MTLPKKFATVVCMNRPPKDKKPLLFGDLDVGEWYRRPYVQQPCQKISNSFGRTVMTSGLITDSHPESSDVQVIRLAVRIEWRDIKED